MKEAAGEANLTVVAIILIGVIVAVVTPVINSMMTNTQKRTCCENYGGRWESNKCQSIKSDGSVGGDIAETSYWDKDNKTCK